MEDYWSLPEPATSAGLATANWGKPSRRCCDSWNRLGLRSGEGVVRQKILFLVALPKCRLLMPGTPADPLHLRQGRKIRP
jgi:hypothetical protein